MHRLPADAIRSERVGETIVEANSVGLPLIQNLRLPQNDLIEQTTTQASKQAMLTGVRGRGVILRRMAHIEDRRTFDWLRPDRRVN